MALWDSRYDGPSCPTGCTGLSLPGNSIAECPDDYKLSIAEFRHLFLVGTQVNGGTGKIEAITTPSNWASESGYAGLTHLVGFGDKPKGEAEVMPLPGFLNRVIDRNHTFNFDVTDASQDNLDLLRQLQCGKSVAFWAWTHDGIAYGGPDGIIAEIDPGLVFTRGKTPVTGNIVLTWSNKFDPLTIELAEAGALTAGPGPARFKAPPPPPLKKSAPAKTSAPSTPSTPKSESKAA